MIEAKWEYVLKTENTVTTRLAVIEGWLYRVEIYIEGKLTGSTVTFVPDAKLIYKTAETLSKVPAENPFTNVSEPGHLSGAVTSSVKEVS